MSQFQCDVVVIGSCNMDMTVRCKDLPIPGQTMLGDSFYTNPGGKGANQAVAAAKLGAKTQIVARVGNGMFVPRFFESYDRVGLGHDFVVRDPETPSGTALIFVDEDGENMIVVAPGANQKLSTADLDAARPVIEGAKVMILQLEVPLETVIYAAKMAKSYGTTVILNPAPVRQLPPELLQNVDIIVANEVEVMILSGAKDVDTSTAAAACRPIIESGVDCVITTLGKDGAVIATRDSASKVRGFKVNAIDTTSAGDTFVGALACGLTEEMSLEDATRFANAAAALSAT
ncbi:MAG: ribokinase, partial [Armatimonadetes bacterium]|nr:ribokinase [Armatimonadota bacterium]